MSRTKNSLRNMAFGLGGQLLNIVMSFIMRVVLVHTLGAVYTGINGTFTEILMVFSLADLGVGTSIIFSLYKPIAEGNTQKIRELMGLYKKAYTIIGFVIIALGAAMTPFLDIFLTDAESVPNMEIIIIFWLFVANTASTYFLSYKGTLITAHQKNYIVTNVVYSTSVVCYGIQIALLLTTQNYILVLSVQVATNILQNVITMIIANKKYPYIKGKMPPLESSERSKVFKNMSAAVFYRIGAVVTNGTDNLVIAAFIGTITMGIYSNYLLLTTTIKNLLLQIFKAITASMGNLNAIESDQKKYDTYMMIYFGNFWLFGFATACFWVLISPFVELVFGDFYVMSDSVVALCLINFYTMGMRNVNTTFRETMGIFVQGKWVPLIGAAINVVASIVLVQYLGIVGVFLGTIVSTVTFVFWMEPLILFKHGFKRSPAMYFVKYLIYFVATAIACVLSSLAADALFSGGGVGNFIGRFFTVMIIPNVVFLLIFFKDKHFKALAGAFLRGVKRKMK